MRGISGLLLGVLLFSMAQSQVESLVLGKIRVQDLGGGVFRVEEKGAKGFEDRATFNIKFRPTDVGAKRLSDQDVELSGGYILHFPSSETVEGATLALNGKVVHTISESDFKDKPLPSPGSTNSVFTFADSPRVVPAGWGATPIPDYVRLTADGAKNSGWDLDNQARDLYLVVRPTRGSLYKSVVASLKKLMGPTPMPPLWAFGLWNSRYYPYTEQESYDSIAKYRQRGFPLDVFVVDTDWRVGASHGYKINEKCFPDMGRFLKRAKELGVATMFNDHPEPTTPTALDPAEMSYRYQSLKSLLDLGADSWWYDRNWYTHLREPVPGFQKEVWGMAIYHDAQLRERPNIRPMIMSNVPGIDNGVRNYPSPLISRTYPIWWTGDTSATWNFLRSGVANAVDSGVEYLLPYMSEDLGGHVSRPTNELYVRFLQYGALSPIMRIHCTANQNRYPWEYGSEAEEIIREYTQLRYRLMPYLYATAYQAMDLEPMVRRLDLEFPNEPGAKRNDQYLLGDHLLVAPIVRSKEEPKTIPLNLTTTSTGQRGWTAEFWKNIELRGTPERTVTLKSIGHDYPPKGLLDADWPSENWSSRYKTTFGPAPKTGIYTFSVTTDDGARIWVKGKKILDEWRGQPPSDFSGSIELKEGESVPVVVEYNQMGGGAVLNLGYSFREKDKVETSQRTVWIPPGTWVDVFTAKVYTGPAEIKVRAPLWQTPMFVRDSGAVLNAVAPKDHAQGRSFDKVFWDVYAMKMGSGASTSLLYEDDGKTNDYLEGKNVKMEKLRVGWRGPQLHVRWEGNGKRERTLRVHFPANWRLISHSVKGGSVEVETIPFKGSQGWKALMPFRGEDAGPVSNKEKILELRLKKGANVTDIDLNFSSPKGSNSYTK